MSNLKHLTLENLKWIRDNAFVAAELRINEANLNTIWRAKGLIQNKTPEKIGCFSCSARSYFKVAKSVIHQHKQQILDRIEELESAHTNSASTQIYHVEETYTETAQDTTENVEITTEDSAPKPKKRKYNKTNK